MEEKENTENAEMGKRKHSHDTKIVIKYYYERIRQNTRNFLKWMGFPFQSVFYFIRIFLVSQVFL